jgi:archaeal type IV pilus assembly protein PilA
MMNFKKNVRKIRRNVKAISPVISTLLMIAVAVVASLVAYAWVMGYIGDKTSTTGQAVQIQSVAANSVVYNNANFTIYVQNVGESAVTLSGSNVFINGAQATVSSINGTAATTNTQFNLGVGNTVAIVCKYPSTLSIGVQQITFKVATTTGTFSQVTQQFTISAI